MRPLRSRRRPACALRTAPAHGYQADARAPGACRRADAVFGKVIDGLDTLDAIERTPNNEKHRPLTDVQLERVTIHANPLAEQMIVFPTASGPPDIQA